MSRRVLIVSPHFPPINAADHQRVRMALPYFETFGWQPHVLTVKPNYVEDGVIDPLLQKTLPAHIPITYTNAVPIQLTRPLGLGSLGLRAFFHLLQAGDHLLKHQKFDLIYFSTTIFTTMALGPRWHQRYNIPYIIDFQDPWLSDYYKQLNAPTPPGGWLKYSFAQLQAKLLEPKTLSKTAHITSVSPAYPKLLQQRYPYLRPDQFTVLPFGASEADFEVLPTLNIQQSIFDPNDGQRHWVYVGRGGHDMALALRSLFLAIQTKRHQNPDLWKTIKLHFVGTSYAPKALATKTVEPIAQSFGLLDIVTEYPQRIPYFEAIQTLVDSDAILMIGSNDPGYTASKLYPCILAQKPILAIFHQQSSIPYIMNHCQAGQAITFTEASQPSDILPQVSTQIEHLLSNPKGFQPNINWQAFKAYTANSMTAKLCEIFDQY